ncbi:MAG: bifunctional proline dehydrogenase/L-glutamate gamma-semialdehyde dehydrogenase PutA [Rhizobiaceae bacterium]
MEKSRKLIRKFNTISETRSLEALQREAKIDAPLRKRISERAAELVERIRADSDASMMELFLGEYGLSSDEGVALMCLAEALLRVPDGATMDALIEDKIAPSKWDHHLGQSHSSLVNASTWALFMTGRVLDEEGGAGVVSVLRGAIKRLGEPIIRQAVTRVMKELGKQFVLGETIQSAMKQAKQQEQKGFTYSYDMLGEAARTEADAKQYHLAYSQAIGELAKASHSENIQQNPGISIKLSALHPRYETMQRERVMDELVPRALSLAALAKSAGIGFNIDAEEAGRLDLSLDVIEALLSDPSLKGWSGFGVVVQAYGQRATYVLDWLYALTDSLNRQIMVRLVKGAYWDTEIKLAQVEGHDGFSVFTQKASTDVSYICCAKKLLAMTDRIYPQFATHNAHTVAAILEMADDKSAFEFQRLHGMGEALHETVLRRQGTRCRIYAPVGAHKDLLAYLVRRLLENGANSSFVNQIVDETVSPEEVAADPFEIVQSYLKRPQNPIIQQPQNLFMPARKNSKGWDLNDPKTLEQLETELVQYDGKQWKEKRFSGEKVTVKNPANGEVVGTLQFATKKEALSACNSVIPWASATAKERAKVLFRTADLFEENASEIFALLMAEAGKTLLDCVGELREAVDFLRYYASQAVLSKGKSAGVFTCISPWNFPLAIFTGQISAALAAGNGVLAKPAESTPLIASLAVSLLKEAGVPEDVLHLLPGRGREIGSVLTSHERVDGVCFTGSTATAQSINRSMAEHLAPHAPLIAETGGLNAMIVDSTALPEQAIMDIVTSAFQSAGQRCSALRMLYLQEDIADEFLTMLYGVMDELVVSDPRLASTDVGPVIDAGSRQNIQNHIERFTKSGNLLKQIDAPHGGTFVGPTVLSVKGIEDLEEEIFGPVLHVCRYEQKDFGTVINAINAKGYGLTFGLHSRIDDRVNEAIDSVEAGNIYINRNQIGAVVGSQPFGGEGLSGTGPKAGGPRYLKRFNKITPLHHDPIIGNDVSVDKINLAFCEDEPLIPKAVEATELPGPTGESNMYSLFPRGRVLCLGPSTKDAEKQAEQARALGCNALAVAVGVLSGLDGVIAAEALNSIEKLDAVISWSSQTSELRQALAKRNGPIVPLLNDEKFEEWLLMERHVCIDTTAAGGNATLLGG